MIRVVVAAALAAATGCVTVTPPTFMREPADRAWTPTLTRARDLAATGRAAGADSLLAAYSATYPRAPQAIEANYWRAVLDLTAPGPDRSALVTPLLETYVAAGPATEHPTEAAVLLHAVTRLDTLSHIAEVYVSKGEVASDVANDATAKTAGVKADLKAVSADKQAQDDEIRRLRDELAKSKDELERIKKRLAEPPKKPPTS